MIYRYDCCQKAIAAYVPAATAKPDVFDTHLIANYLAVRYAVHCSTRRMNAM